MSASFDVAIIQHNPVVGDIKGNTEALKRAIDSAASTDADLVVTTELAVCGYPPQDLLYRNTFIDQQETAVDELAAHTKGTVPVIVGHARAAQAPGAPVKNAATLLRNGERYESYAKQLLPTYDVFDEHRYFQPGTGATTATINGVRIGITICEDAWGDVMVNGQQRYSKRPLKRLQRVGADVIVNLSASPFTMGKPEQREQRFSHHADETDCPVVFANQVGATDQLIFDGNSFVIGANGQIIDRLQGYAEQVQTVSIPHSKEGHVSPRGGLSDARQARHALRVGVIDYFEKTNFETAIIGMSGGIDSSVTAALAVDALGAENVHGVSLPSAVTSSESTQDARTVAEGLGIQFDVIPIEESVSTVASALADGADTEATGVTKQNMQARIRGDMLMCLANELGALVLTPNNKSETAVGYYTLYGDSVGALAPLGDCYKTVVYNLADEYNDHPPTGTQEPVIPKQVIDKPPSAELAESQTDTDDIPPYDRLDPLLTSYIENGDSGNALRSVYDDELINSVVPMVAQAEFKRQQMPPVLRVTKQSIGRGWSYPLAARYSSLL